MPSDDYLDHLTEEQVCEYKEAFAVFDDDQSQSIDHRELGKLMKSLGQNFSEEELQSILEELDDDGSGELEFPEFCSIMIRVGTETDEKDDILDAFSTFDIDASGRADNATLWAALVNHGGLTDKEARRFIAEGDPDKTGSIDYTAFAERMAGAAITKGAATPGRKPSAAVRNNSNSNTTAGGGTPSNTSRPRANSVDLEMGSRGATPGSPRKAAEAGGSSANGKPKLGSRERRKLLAAEAYHERRNSRTQDPEPFASTPSGSAPRRRSSIM